MGRPENMGKYSEMWDEKERERQRDAQLNILKGKYGVVGRDAKVLWIIAELALKEPPTAIGGEISVKTKGGMEIEIPYMARHPYPGKKICQLSMKDGKKRLYGIPLLFESMEDLKRVSEVTIRWNAFDYETFGDLKARASAWCVEAKRTPVFEDGDGMFYTLKARDYVDNMAEGYYEGFETAMSMDGVLSLVNDGCVSLLPSDCMVLNEDKERPLTDRESAMIMEMQRTTPDMGTLTKVMEDAKVKGQAAWHVRKYEKPCTLESDDIAAILAIFQPS